MKWWPVLFVGWAAALSASGIKHSLPASYWFKPEVITVADSRVGTCPRMEYEREIVRPFSADWTVTIMRERLDGSFYTYRVYHGASDYRPGNELPDELTMAWWVNTDVCDWPAGDYRLHTLWRLTPPNGPEREVRRSSNVFTVGE